MKKNEDLRTNLIPTKKDNLKLQKASFLVYVFKLFGKNFGKSTLFPLQSLNRWLD